MSAITSQFRSTRFRPTRDRSQVEKMFRLWRVYTIFPAGLNVRGIWYMRSRVFESIVTSILLIVNLPHGGKPTSSCPVHLCSATTTSQTRICAANDVKCIKDITRAYRRVLILLRLDDFKHCQDVFSLLR